LPDLSLVPASSGRNLEGIMSLSRRAFVRGFAPGVPLPSAAAIAARGREAWTGENLAEEQAAARPVPDGIRLSSNEHPLGPSAPALEAIRTAFGFAGRYPMNARPAMADLRSLIAKRNGLAVENVLLGAGSGELLDACARAFTSSSLPLVAALPTFEQPGRTARQLGAEVREIPVDGAGRLDCEKMVAATPGAGLFFLCNPNNPTGAVHSSATVADTVARVAKASPSTIILIDEAYHEYVTDPSYATAIPLVSQQPNVIVSRTFSKAFGMAGLRLGYAIGHAAAIKRLQPWMMPYNANSAAVAAAVVSLEDEAQIAREQRRNAEAREYTASFFKSAGYAMSDSQANFIWVDLRRPAREFREACQKQGILVGRDFPPFEKTHCRISIGTMDEMQKAVAVFRTALGAGTDTARKG
jgi:histidinol-phosphate aminotransferase